ncbi:MAG TPA: hypothetical protein VHW60_14515 [Caulobacteraceae bacterium]|nr:hypothetical protein [Caulobacteraceae bacterium]
MALAFGVVFSFLIPESGAPYLYAAGIGVFVAYILSNLAGNKKVPAGSDADRQQALAMRAPPGKALLIPYRQGFVAKMAGLNLALDGNEFAQLTAPKFTAITISPGRHTLAGAFGGFAGAQSKAASYEFDAPDGAVLVLRIDSRMGLLQGAVVFTPETDLAAAKAKLSGMPMAAADQGAVSGFKLRSAP